MVETGDGRTQASVDAKNLVVNYLNSNEGRKMAVLGTCRETEVVKHFCAISPDGDRAVLSETLVVESIDLGKIR